VATAAFVSSPNILGKGKELVASASTVSFASGTRIDLKLDGDRLEIHGEITVPDSITVTINGTPVAVKGTIIHLTQDVSDAAQIEVVVTERGQPSTSSAVSSAVVAMWKDGPVGVTTAATGVSGTGVTVSTSTSRH
jgi:hypothetical protein